MLQLWLLCLLVHWSLLLAIPVMSFCPPRCKCNEVKLLVLCNSTQILDSVPIMLNPSLKELYLSGNRIKNVYSSFTVYQELRYLDLSYNLISDLGKSSFIMQKKLRVLLLTSNNITQIGSRIFMGLNRLEILDLSFNQISLIAREAFLGLLNLKQLNLQSNRLVQVPSFFHLENLLRLNLASNLLTTLSELAFSPLTQLQELDMQSNQLYHVPSESLSELRNLQVIILSQNPITALRPKSFRDLRLLTTLVISNTPLSYVDRDALRDNVHLSRLIMDNNRQLSFIPLTMFASQRHSLTHISLRADRISSLEQGTLNLDRIEYLDLRDNPLVCNCSLSWLSDYLRSSNESLSVQGQVKCHRPASHLGKTLITLSRSDLSCPGLDGTLQDTLGMVTGGIVTVLLLALLIVYLTLLCMRHRPNCLRGSRSSSLSHTGIARPIIISSSAAAKSRLDHSLYYPAIINEEFTRDKHSHYHTMTTSTRTSALSVDLHPPLHYASIANI